MRLLKLYFLLFLYLSLYRCSTYDVHWLTVPYFSLVSWVLMFLFNFITFFSILGAPCFGYEFCIFFWLQSDLYIIIAHFTCVHVAVCSLLNVVIILCCDYTARFVYCSVTNCSNKVLQKSCHSANQKLMVWRPWYNWIRSASLIYRDSTLTKNILLFQLNLTAGTAK